MEQGGADSMNLNGAGTTKLKHKKVFGEVAPHWAHNK